MNILFIHLVSAQNRSKTHDVYNALTGVDIKIDGKISDWDGVFDAVVGTDGKPFIDLPAGDGGKKLSKNMVVESGTEKMTIEPEL